MIPGLIHILDKHIRLVDERMAHMISLRNDIVEYRRHMF